MNQPEPSQRKNLIWIPLGFSAAYLVGSCAVGFESPFVAMWQLRSQTDPVLADRFGKGEYRFTEDFIPMYFPGFMRFPDAPQRADDRCLYWGRPAEREIAKDAAARPATIDVSFARGPDQPMSRHSLSLGTYSQNTFYHGALGAGARECP